MGFKNLGIRLSKSTENLNHDGHNNLVGEREFHFKKLFIEAVEDEVVSIQVRNGG